MLFRKLQVIQICKELLQNCLIFNQWSRLCIENVGEWAETTNGEPFVIGTRGEDDKIILLGTNANLKLLEAADSIYMDGTFKTCPQLYAFNCSAFNQCWSSENCSNGTVGKWELVKWESSQMRVGKAGVAWSNGSWSSGTKPSDCSTSRILEPLWYKKGLNQHKHYNYTPWIETQKGGRALLSRGYWYLSIRKGIEGWEFWWCCLRTYVARATTVGDQLEAVRWEHNHAPKEKVQATGAESSADQKQNVSRTSFISNAIGHVTGL